MNHIVKFSTSYNFCAFSKKYYGASFGTRCMCRQKLLHDQVSGCVTYESAVLEKTQSKKPGKKYNTKLKKTDLLKVTKTRATQEKMTVAKLKASQFAAFAQEPGMFLDDLYNMEFRKRASPYRERISSKNEASYNALKPMFSPEEESILQEKTAANVNLFYQVMTSKLRNINNNEFLLAYLDVCLNSGLSVHAHQYMETKGSKSKNFTCFYEPFICKYIEDNKFSKVEDLLVLMERRGVKLSSNIVSLYFDYLYRSKLTDKLKVRKAQEILMIYKLLGGKVEEISAGAGLCSKRNVLEVLRWAYPNLKDSDLDKPPSRCQLIERLYKDASTRISPSHPAMNREDIMKLVAEQLDLEKSLYLEIDSVFPRYKYRSEKTNKWNRLMDIWRKNLRQNLILNLEAIKTAFSSSNVNIYPFVNCLKVDDMVDIMLREIELTCEGSQMFSTPSSITFTSLGQKVWERYNIQKKYNSHKSFKEYESLLKKYFEWYLNPGNSKQNYREKWINLVGESNGSSFLNEKNFFWTDGLKNKLGRFLFDIIFKAAVIPESFFPKRMRKGDVPGLYLVVRAQPGEWPREQIKAHPVLFEIHKRDRSHKLLFEVKNLPTVCPPKPWISTTSGGFYTTSSRFLRYTPLDYNLKKLSKLPADNLSNIFDSLNQLQSVAWVMNCDVLDVAIKVFKDGGSEELNVPVNPDSLPSQSKVSYYERKKMLQQKHDLYGLWCECLYKLSLANHFRNRVFWLPYNIDFRGRVYPVPPHVNHICSDLYRSLYVFAKKKPLGPKGLDWLKIHCINLCGTHKKQSLSERLEYANEMLPEILDSAENPLNGRRWWAKAEDSWQALSTCMEIRNALKSGNPETYETGFPVHQDGSCNGLQHYAALGRDPIGAGSVNLAPSATPKDVYEVVVKIVEGMRKEDVENGVEIAKLLEGFVVRKVIKQTVMTTVYGVTFFGAKAQIASKLKDFKDFPENEIGPASAYLAKKVFGALNEMFTSAREIQRWFIKCAHMITSELGESVTWVTPLGLPVSQPYFKNRNTSGRFDNLLPEKRKQGNAFPPNFIHSLDSSHMMLTALSCGIQGITFASIHDCFWTHPADIDKMNVICRSRFVELHSENILQDLAKHFLEEHNKSDKADAIDRSADVFKAVPKKGKFNLSEVSESVYFFS